MTTPTKCTLPKCTILQLEETAHLLTAIRALKHAYETNSNSWTIGEWGQTESGCTISANWRRLQAPDIISFCLDGGFMKFAKTEEMYPKLQHAFKAANRQIAIWGWNDKQVSVKPVIAKLKITETYLKRQLVAQAQAV